MLEDRIGAIKIWSQLLVVIFVTAQTSNLCRGANGDKHNMRNAPLSPEHNFSFTLGHLLESMGSIPIHGNEYIQYLELDYDTSEFQNTHLNIWLDRPVPMD
jgi:hypothetical protein